MSISVAIGLAVGFSLAGLITGISGLALALSMKWSTHQVVVKDLGATKLPWQSEGNEMSDLGPLSDQAKKELELYEPL